jgi:hypothetical protein
MTPLNSGISQLDLCKSDNSCYHGTLHYFGLHPYYEQSIEEYYNLPSLKYTSYAFQRYRMLAIFSQSARLGVSKLYFEFLVAHRW